MCPAAASKDPYDFTAECDNVNNPTSSEYGEPNISEPAPEYSDVKCPTPPVYDLPYADVPSADPGGFVSIGRGCVTQYEMNEGGTDETHFTYTLPGAIGNPCVELYQGAFEADMQCDESSINDNFSTNYILPGAIGQPSVEIYEGSSELASSQNYAVYMQRKHSSSSDDQVSMNYSLPGAIGQPSVVMYQ